MERQLFQTIDESDRNAGIIVALIIGDLYMFGFIYYIYKKYLSIIFEDLICLLDGKDNEDTYRPVVYSILNGLSFLILCFFSTFSSESDFGIAAIIGSDAFNLFFILSIIFIKFKEFNHGVLDTWIQFRDTIIYILGLISLMLFLLFKWINLWAAIIMIVFYLINYSVLSANQDIKEKVMEWLGLNNEDNEFNSDDHFQCRKRRESCTQLMDQGCFDSNDTNLQKKLNRMEALLTLKFGSADHPKKKMHAKFQKVVYQIIFAIRNQARIEKQKRTDFYISMYKPKQKKKIESNEDEQVIDMPKNQQKQPEDDDPFIQKESVDKEKNQQEMNDVDQENKLIQKEDEEFQQNQVNQNQHNNVNQQQEEESLNENGVSLKMPKSIGQKILFIIFFPVHLILFLLPNYLENPIPKKLVLCFFLNVVLLCGCMFLIDWWTLELALATGIPFQLLGIIFAGSMMSIHFLEYNYKVGKEEKQLEYVQSFFQIGICKVSLCPAIPWIFKVIVKLDLDVTMSTPFSFSIAIAIFAGIIFLFLLLAIFSRFRLGAEEGIKMGILYFLFIVGSIIIIALDI